MTDARITHLARWTDARYVLQSLGLASADGKSWGSVRVPNSALTDGRLWVRFVGGPRGGQTQGFVADG